MSRAGRGRAGPVVRLFVLVGGLASVIACSAIPLGRHQGVPVLERKLVMEKREPNILLAGDRTWCEADRRKFEEAKVGDAVWCLWRRSSLRRP